MVVPVTILTAYGFIWAMGKLVKGKGAWLALLIVLVMVYEFFFYLHFYYQHYPIINSLDWGAGNEDVVVKAEKYQSRFQHIVVDSNLGKATIPLYFGFYTKDKLKPQVVAPDWQKPKSWPNGSTLYIRAYYGNKSSPNIVDTVYLPGPNKDIFAQFWKL